MYTRSYPSRRPLPVDYGGTALTVKGQGQFREEENDISQGTQSNIPKRPISFSRSEQRQPIFPPPFGYEDREEPLQENEPRQEILESTSEPETQEIQATEDSHVSPSLFSVGNLKSDDLLLLGLAFLLYAEKNNSDDGQFPTDALLILAMLYLSGI